MKSWKKFFEGTLAKESAGKKLLVMITGYRVPLRRLKETWHVYPLEDVHEEDGSEVLKRQLLAVPKDEGRDEIIARLSKAADSGTINSHVWATPGLPMLIFITIGLVVALLFGDVVWILISAVLR